MNGNTSSHNGSLNNCNSVFDENGHEVFETTDIIEAYRKEFDNRLSGVDIKPALEAYKTLVENLCAEVIKTTAAVKVPDFSMKELELVISKLKKGKSCGPDKKPAEVYMYGGTKFQQVLLKVINILL